MGKKYLQSICLIVILFAISNLYAQNTSQIRRVRNELKSADTLLVNYNNYKQNKTFTFPKSTTTTTTYFYGDQPPSLQLTPSNLYKGGTNEFSDRAVWERFDIPAPAFLNSFTLFFGAVNVIGTSDNIKVVIHPAQGNNPANGPASTILYMTTLATNQIDITNGNVFNISPIAVPEHFFIGIEWDPILTDDEFGLFMDATGNGDNANRVWVLQFDFTLWNMNDVWFDINSDLWISAEVLSELPLGSISGKKFEDLNANGFQDNGELGIANWNIVLTPGDTVSTDSSGNYTFTNLEAGTYQVSEVGQFGWTRTLPAAANNYTIILSKDEQRTDVNFGNFHQITAIRGRKYWDKNGNGIIDTNDVPLPGFTIKLSTGDSTVTDSAGLFSFDGLQAGQYGVSEIQQFGYIQTLPANNGSYQVALSIGEVDTSSIFANRPLSTIKGRKYWDKNGNGIIDTNDVPLQGFTIKLSTGDSTVTDSTGLFSFEGLQAGQYRVSESLKKGWEQTLPTNNGSYQVPLNLGETDTTSIFANKLTATISGQKFNDINFSHSKDQGEPGLANYTIIATYDGKTVEAVTDLNGYYKIIIDFKEDISVFVDLKEKQKPGWIQTIPNANYNFEVSSGNIFLKKDFGNYFLGGTIDGLKFQDNNGNGIRDEQDPPLSGIENGLKGWIIKLSNGQTDTTNEYGLYSFDKLEPGNYFISEISKTNWTQTFPSGFGTHNVEIADVETIHRDFGNQPTLGEISGYLFKDVNGNNVFDSDEDPLNGWKVFLFDSSYFTTTNSLGFYKFANLQPNGYRLFSEIRNGWEPTTSFEQIINLNAGEDKRNIDFGIRLSKRSIIGNVNDEDNPIFGLSGWSVVLNGGGLIKTDITDKDGLFIFEVEPGQSYSLALTLINGWKFVNPPNGNQNIFVDFDNVIPDQDFIVKPIAGSLLGDIKSFFGLGKLSNKTKQLLKITGTNGLPPTPIPVSLEIFAREDSVVYDTLTFIDTTDALGKFSFNVPLGSYTLKPLLPPGWKYDATSDTMFTGSIDTIGTTVSNVSFTVNPPATITGQKFLDLNRNGVQDPTEVGLDSVEIQLFDNNNNLLQTQTTHSIEINGDSTINRVTESGLFLFQPLNAGNYVVKEKVPTGWMRSFPAVQDSYQVALSDGQIVDSLIFGNKLPDSLDYGDLPSPYKTLLLGNGPKHKLGGYLLGANIDKEADGQPQVVAIGDDQTGSVNDEDGVVFTDKLVSGSTVTIQVTVVTPSAKSGFLNGWIDFNQDGILDDTTAEHIFKDTTLSTGSYALSYTVPDSALKGVTFARFRFSDTPGLLPIDFPPYSNLDISVGEVEDYVVGIDTLLTSIRIDRNASIPKEFKLFQNFPNPFNPSTTIQYSVKEATDVKLEVFNVLGQSVMILVDEFQNSGTYKAIIDFNKLTSGVYFYRIQMGSFVQSKKMILLK